MSLTVDTSHLEMSWLNETIQESMYLIRQSLDTSHSEMSWLNELVALNILTESWEGGSFYIVLFSFYLLLVATK